jgi:hypothetical protein
MSRVKTLFRWTTSLPEVMAQARRNPVQTFEDWPLVEVRTACLQEISVWIDRNTPRFDEKTADWIESFLLEAEGAGSGNRDPFGADALAWYVAVAPEKLGARAIEFAIQRRGAWENQYVSKIVNGRLKKDPWLWEGISNLIDFLEESLTFLWSDEHSNVYDERSWITAERALRMIARAEEVRLKPNVLRIQKSLQNRNLTPWGTPGSAEHSLRLAEHKALVRETLRILNAA